MGRELARIGGNVKPLADTFDFRLQSVEVRRWGYTRIDAVRLFGTESIDTRQVEHEFRPPHAIKRIGNLVGHVAFHISDKTQRYVVVFDINPACAGETASQQRERKRGVARDFEGSEKTRHKASSSKRSMPERRASKGCIKDTLA